MFCAVLCGFVRFCAIMRDGEYRVGQLIPGEVPGTGGTTGTRPLHDLGVVTSFPLDEHVASCTVGTTGVPLATFHKEPGSSLYSLHTGSHHTGSGQVADVSCDCLSHVTPQLYSPQHPIPVVSGGAGGAAAEGGGTGAAGPSGADSGGAAGVRMETTLVEDTAGSTRRPHPASPPGFSSNPRFPPRSSLWQVTVEPGGILAGGTRDTGGAVAGGSGSGGAGAEDTGSATPTPRTLHFLTREQRLLRLEREEPEQFERAQQQQQHQ
ncbi:unnamed protein product [Closterium sp. NIES-54]